MIRLNVEEYCHQCMDFVPDVTDPARVLSEDGRTIMQSDTIIQCEHRRRCEAIKRYLIQQAKDEVVG